MAAIRVVTRIQDQDDFTGTPAGSQMIVWDSTSSIFTPKAPSDLAIAQTDRSNTFSASQAFSASVTIVGPLDIT